MKINRLFILLTFMFVSGGIFAQEYIEGVVYEEVEGKKEPLPGVNIFWKTTTQGTVSDGEGRYKIEVHPSIHCLVFSYVAYENDTVHQMNRAMHYDHVMTTSRFLSEVEVTARKKGSYVSSLETRHAEHITVEGIRRAACCSLAESFETNASVDVAYSDAVTGAKQIELLGLSGIYTQMMAENMPNFRGLASAFGLNYVPGTWMNGIQISKGTSSVRNGYESISGQINVDYKKPEKGESETLFLNLFGNTMSNGEVNFNARTDVGQNGSMMILGHVNHNFTQMDDNDDGFMDDPMVTQYNVFARYNYANDKWFEGMWGIKALQENRYSGQMDFNPDKENTGNLYGISIKTKRIEAFSKTGFMFKRHDTSLGIQQQFTYHDLDSYFGPTVYDASQISYYANALFDSYIVSEHHKYSVGASYSYDKYDEKLIDDKFIREENVPGVFAEYVFSDEHHWSVIAGVRGDYNSYYGQAFCTPRLHVRFKTHDELTLRLSAGKGYRSPNILAENSTIMASSRIIRFLDTPKMEEAWNFGINLTKHFDIGEKELELQVDVYRTDFVNQVVLDRDADVHEIRIYNLDGQSYSNSAQIELSCELFRNFDATAAFRYNDVKMTIDNELREKPFVNKYKGLVTLSYAPKSWQFDFTTQFNGDCRVPSLKENATAVANDQDIERSPFYVIMNVQVTKKLNEHFEIYAGGENLTNYKQKNPIISAGEPLSEDFDASMVWGPLSGIRGYVGLRYQIK